MSGTFRRRRESDGRHLAIAGLLLLAYLSMMPGLRFFELTLEEPRRALVAYEMWFSGRYLQPTLLGEPYFNKPPLFNWLVILSSMVFGWGELAVRAVSLAFNGLTALLIHIAGRERFGGRGVGALAALIYVTLADTLYHYGWIGEIDATLAFFVFSMILCLWRAFETGRRVYPMLAGTITGLMFLLKGFPAYAFLGLTLLALAVHCRQWRPAFRAAAVVGYGVSVAIPACWIFWTDVPSAYMQRLFVESISRATSSHGIGEFALHLLGYPVLTVKQLLPLSVVVPVLFWRERLRLTADVKAFLLIVGMNYLPYWLSIGSRGRYILPLFPLVSLLFAQVIQASRERWQKIALALIAAVIVGRFAYGLVGFPWMMERRGSLRAVGQEIARRLDGKPRVAVACQAYALAYYININAGVKAMSEKALGDWDYLVSCEGPRGGKLIGDYATRRHEVFLYAR